MKSVTTHEAKTHLSRLLAEVERGQEVVIRRGAREVAKLVPIGRQERARPPVGTHTSPPVTVSDDAFAPLTDEQLEEWGV
jgi:prevent-host-death family protein